MKMLLLGAGMMGRAIAYDLARSPEVSEVHVADIDIGRAEGLIDWVGSEKLKAAQVNVRRSSEVIPVMRGCQAAISAVPYFFNFGLAQAAVAAGISFCDLGGNMEIVFQELELSREAEKKGITIIPDCGFMPGIANILAALGAKKMDEVEEIHIRDGGLPLEPKPPLGYTILFSPQGLINEYVEKLTIIRNGELVEVEPMTELEEVEFPPPFGTLEAFLYNGGTSTLPFSFKGKVKELDGKCLRYPGHCEKIRFLNELGLTSSEPILIEGKEVKPRNLLCEVLLKNLEGQAPDASLMRVTIKGRKGSTGKELTYQLIDYYDYQNHITSMMRTTGFSISIIGQMLAKGEISAKGALPPELSVPPERFVAELAKRGISISESSQ